MSSTKKDTSYSTTFLVDNGSLRADSTLALRRVAKSLGARLESEIVPVSLLHSSKVPPEKLGGTPAETFIPAVKRRLHAGAMAFRVLPFFFGPSRAFTEYMPERIDALKAQNPDWASLDIPIADPLCDIAQQPEDDRIARALVERVDMTIARHGLNRPSVVMVDHGSPAPEVSKVRNHVGGQLERLLGERCREFSVASMERREGSEYDFNEPLLETVLRQDGFSGGPVVVALLFLSAGRHAGDNGDIAEICADAEKDYPQLKTFRTEPLGEHPLITDILVDRFVQK
ncbi:MAG: CbiX/SirB N-terminal domain-containing protein [Verrucomicrobiota bacterium]